MSSTITTRDISASYERVVRTFREHDFTNPFGAEVLVRTKRAFVDLRALKQALNSLHWDDRKFPGSIRATIRQKKEPVLGLRNYPGYKRDSRLLPYHGVALVTQDIHGGIVVRIEPEINVVGRDSVQRYIPDSGVTDLYLDTKIADR